MRVREMHPLCCISLDCPAAGADVTSGPAPAQAPEEAAAGAGGGGVAGVLHKWTNYGKGWRCRWFLLRDGVLSYSKARRCDAPGDVRVIGKSSPATATSTARKKHKTVGVAHFKVRS